MISIKDLKKMYARRGALWLPVNIFGIRFSEDQEQDRFNDKLGIATDSEIHIVTGTTDPGDEARRKKSGGAAHLCLGFHPDIWAIDTHAAGAPFAHKAFCQRPNMDCKVCTIWRDRDRDGIQGDDDFLQHGFFGINMHRASIRGSENIGPYGYGCQVHNVPDTLGLFLDIAVASKMKLFSYMLFDKSEV